MRILICLVLAAVLSGCLPIGIRGSTMPFQGSSERDNALPPETRAYGEMTAAQFAAMMKSGYERWGRVVKASGWKPSSE